MPEDGTHLEIETPTRIFQHLSTYFFMNFALHLVHHVRVYHLIFVNFSKLIILLEHLLWYSLKGNLLRILISLPPSTEDELIFQKNSFPFNGKS